MHVTIFSLIRSIFILLLVDLLVESEELVLQLSLLYLIRVLHLISLKVFVDLNLFARLKCVQTWLQHLLDL